MGCRMFISLAVFLSDPLGRTVDNAIVMFKNKSRVAPYVTSIPTVPLGRCSTVVVCLLFLGRGVWSVREVADQVRVVVGNASAGWVPKSLVL